MSLQTLTDAQLLEQIAEYAMAEKQAKASAEPFREEMLRRQTETGEVNVKHNGWESILTKGRFSETWLKKAFGYDACDLPEGSIKEKIVPEIDWEHVITWLTEEGYVIPPHFTLTVKQSKVK